MFLKEVTMGFIRRLFERKKVEGNTDPNSPLCFPLFLFDYHIISGKVSTMYGNYAKSELKRRISSLDPVVLDPNWMGFNGDLLDPEAMVQILNITEISPDLSLVNDDIAPQLKSGSIYTVFLVGIGNSQKDIIFHVDSSLKKDNVVGYLGVVLFNPLSQEDIVMLRRALSLPTFDWWNL